MRSDFVKGEADYLSASVSIPSAPQPITDLQGQYLAFIHAYTKLNRRPPAEADMQRYFGTTPPTVHRMVLELERRGLIRRSAGQARSMSVPLAHSGHSLAALLGAQRIHA
ncbi:helix-turn-helix domain-containing protein [Myxococcus sp. K38C18041901]|uniref:LexA family protein n=1 Tax=Myxococcus guangdongensis TaxID=2906760 RepID=UPI0020A75FD9|nr:helix-turn-helix domain-containing protein [Myxococcus guangdongensis]MCP3065753.1 helix-turn-helix domain-containing protein [Myxococcus guangdongensis]